MKSNFNELFEERLDEFQNATNININDVLDDMMPEFRFTGNVTKSKLSRWFLRTRLTTALNANKIYSYEKGKFIFIENANEEQLIRIMDKAKRDIEAADVRKSNAENMLNQISMAWDDNGHFIGYHIPKAVNQ